MAARWTSATRSRSPLTAVANTQANRHFTFGVRGRAGLCASTLAGALVYLLALALTGGALDVCTGVDPPPRTVG